jgi:hypothetical protein
MAMIQAPRRADGIVARRIAGELLLVPVRGQLADLQRLYVLNPVAELIWGLLDGRHELPAIQDAIASRFAVSPATAGADLKEFIDSLHAAGLLATGL